MELLFSCIRSRNGFNNNPNTVQLKSALRKILLRNSITASNKSNVLAFESTASCGSIFALKASKRTSPITDSSIITEENNIESVNANNYYLNSILENVQHSLITENILFYITGFIVRRILPFITCFDCTQSLIIKKSISNIDHIYHEQLPSHDSLVKFKDRGGLIIPSDAAFKIVETAEKVFKINVIHSNQMANKKNLLKKLVIDTVSAYNWRHYFCPLSSDDHWFEVSIGFEDDHLTQLIKKISTKYFDIRLNTYAKIFTRENINKNKPSSRHHLNKMVLFQNI